MRFESIQEMVGGVAPRLGDRVAIRRGAQTVSYGELERRSNALAHHLIAGGAGPGAVVAVLSDDAVELAVAALGILKAGAVFVPLHPEIPEARLRALVAEVAPRRLLADAKHAQTVSRLASYDGLESRVVWLGDGLPDAARPSLQYDPDAMCYVYFTSGSTGRPKGIAGRLKGIGHFVRWEIEALGLGEGVRVSQLISPSFDAFLRDIFTPLCAGGTVCVPDDRDVALDGRRLVEWLERERVNLVHCVPTLFRSLLNAGLGPDSLPALKHVLLSGERLLPSDVKRWADLFGDRVQLVNLYGPSETTMTKLFYFVQPSDAERPSIPIGKPMPGSRALVMDARGRECPRGVVGEIYIRTPFRSLGYFNQPELTKEVFVQNPLNADPNDIVYRTGDLGRVLEGGDFEFLGRKDSQVKVNGVRVELAEIENLLRGHDSVKDVAVAAREDAGGGNYLCAYVVAGEAFDAPALRDFLSESLPSYMLPSVFMKMDALPRTLNGKVDRRALPEPAPAGAVDDRAADPVEEIIAGIWAETLGRPHVGVNDNFFNLGGHSLLVAQLLLRVRKSLQVELPLRVVFEAPTVAAMAEAVRAALRTGAAPTQPPLEPARRNGTAPLSIAQEGLWLFDRVEPGNPVYHLPAAVRLSGEVDIHSLRRALDEVTRRHEALRTTFAVIDGRPAQVVAASAAQELCVTDLRGVSGQEQEAEVRSVCAEEPRRPFDLAAGPLVRVSLLQLGEREHVLLLTMHHIISDAWSIEQLMRELLACYESYSKGAEPDLPEPTIHYADYAIWQRGWLTGEVLEAQLSYWKRQLGNAPELMELPLDRPRPAEQTFNGALHRFELPEPLKQELKSLGRREGCTTFMTLLAVYYVLLHYYSGAEDIVVGTPVANRNRAETERVVGYFTNTLVLRTDLSGDPSFAELLGRVREVALAAYAHQDAPFARVVDAVKLKRATKTSPLFNVSFNLLGTPAGPAPTAGDPALSLTPLPVEVGVTPFDLILAFRDAAEGMEGLLTYNTDLFDEGTATKTADHFINVLRAAAAQPGVRLAELRSRLAEHDRRQFFARQKQLHESHALRLRSSGRKAFDIPQATA
ncbi:MAG TPA: amino acid adenylation domain-containing protein [Pyrinomonadaceae bacterium]|jgi:amino acid adenylation domain-containing protein|nr:amino acid adenylation domain-containing protein [Pyrinomonadaceae bacterium]